MRKDPKMEKPKISREALVKKVKDAIKRTAGIDIPPEKHGENLFSLGLDSLKAIQIINALEEDLNIMIDDIHIGKMTSIDAIAAFFESL